MIKRLNDKRSKRGKKYIVIECFLFFKDKFVQDQNKFRRIMSFLFEIVYKVVQDKSETLKCFIKEKEANLTLREEPFSSSVIIPHTGMMTACSYRNTFYTAVKHH